MASFNVYNISPSKSTQPCEGSSTVNQDQHVSDSNMGTSLSNLAKTNEDKHNNSARSYELDLDTREINKLFGILYEPGFRGFGDTAGSEREQLMYEPFQRFTPYPVHQQLYIQQQHEQERRRQSLTSAISNRNIYIFKDHHMMKYKNGPSDGFRNKIVSTVVAFFDKYSDRITSTQNDCTEKCVVCMCNYHVNERMRELKCSHKFHRKCIDEWLVKSMICPVCRTDLTGTGKVFQGFAILHHILKEEKMNEIEQKSASTNTPIKFNQNTNDSKSEGSELTNSEDKNTIVNQNETSTYMNAP